MNLKSKINMLKEIRKFLIYMSMVIKNRDKESMGMEMGRSHAGMILRMRKERRL